MGFARSSYGLRTGVLSSGGTTGVASTVCLLLCSGDMRSTLLCSQYPVSLLFRNGSWVFFCLCIFWSRIFPNWACMQLFLVPYCFFVFCSSRKGMSRCKLCSKGFQVPGLPQKDCNSVHQNISTSFPGVWDDGGGERLGELQKKVFSSLYF